MQHKHPNFNHLQYTVAILYYRSVVKYFLVFKRKKNLYELLKLTNISYKENKQFVIWIDLLFIHASELVVAKENENCVKPLYLGNW